VYSLIAKSIPIYFFWESSFVCWTFLFLALSSLAFNISKLTPNNGLSNILKISILVFIVPILFTYISVFGMRSSKPFTELQRYVTENENIKNDIGKINELSLLPSGSYESTNNSIGNFGKANLNVILKGENKYQKISAYITKEIDSSSWDVIKINYTD
jgi:hypothetical protein